MFIRFLTTGGTIDKIYFDEKSRYEVGESQVRHILAEGLVGFEYDVVSLFRKDSLDLTDADRAAIRRYIEEDTAERYVITHGTDTMVETAKVLQGLGGRTIVLTGALAPARFRHTDAIFNVGMAVAAVQLAPPGVYIAMSGEIFSPGEVVKNRERNRFERIP
jgi:L-asparaginase